MLNIVLIEDDEVDVMHFQRVVAGDALITVQHFSRTRLALQFLLERLEESWLVLLDLNLPGLDGLGFLQELNEHDDLRRVPVVVLTTSDDAHDKAEAWDLGVCGYLLKPLSADAYRDQVQLLLQWWRLNRW